MAKRQTRRTISVNRDIYERFKAYCASGNWSMSSVCEDSILPHIEKWEREKAAEK